MKPIKILQAVTIIAFAALAVGCTSSRYSSSYPSGPGASFSLIIDPYPGIAINRYADGRYYYRNPQGYTYWRGYDNRYYLDKSYVNRNYRNQRDYNDWRRNGNHNSRRHRH
ncbi:MAG: hypothetical protein WDO19_00270 [Bacteroidota bacterium]